MSKTTKSNLALLQRLANMSEREISDYLLRNEPIPREVLIQNKVIYQLVRGLTKQGRRKR